MRASAWCTPMRAASLGLLALLLVSATAAAQATGDRFLLADGSLGTSATGTPSDCVTLTPAGPQSASQRFTGQFSDGPVDLEAQTIVLSLQIGDGATAGTGFRIDASLAIDDLAPLNAQKVYSQGSSVDSPATLAFTLPSPLPSDGNASIEVTLIRLSTAARARVTTGLR